MQFKRLQKNLSEDYIGRKLLKYWRNGYPKIKFDWQLKLLMGLTNNGAFEIHVKK